MISRTAEYALRAIVWLASRPNEAQTVEAIAGGTRVPVGYLAKILQGLARAGLLHSQRGVGGGFVLARQAAQLSVFDVVQAVDPLLRIHECPLGLPGHGSDLCRLHRLLDGAASDVAARFRSASIASLLDGGGPRPLCAADEVPAG